MGNNKRESIFRFKKFSLSNERSAMKVSTDGVLLGAWCPLVFPVSRAWDVGAGTGLISLMLAQRGVGRIDAVEVDPVAVDEALGNVAFSDWEERICVVCGDILDVADSLPRPDLIVSNPPFFTDSLKSPSAQRNFARHEGRLNYERLVEMSARYLTEKGTLCMISPFDKCDDIRWYAALNKLFVWQCIAVRSVENRAPIRALWQIGRENRCEYNGEISIRKASPLNAYTAEYKNLTNDFYVKL